ncbi:polysaccharide biosynthesis protein [Granulicella arctica]|uniref:polysaccharide biosynthesis protein n=1 Tax=Granulicella arctica TaxID=940613 RepID=UPI0021DFD93D|nr:polysaccharide biosynthesis protein [Granulicella arctica]
MRDQTADWMSFLGRELECAHEDLLQKSVTGKRVFITGAGGYIGSALARYLSNLSVQSLTLLDIAEGGLFELYSELEDKGDTTQLTAIVGDVCDMVLLREIFEQHQPQIVFHAAACKHVTLMETNPFAAMHNNVIGTHQLLAAANDGLAEQVIVVSTDKAVEPFGMMGVSKRIAELLVVANPGPVQVKAVRLANVLGSTGSVGPIFVRQICHGGPVQITHPGCTRYFLSIDEVVQRLMSALLVEGTNLLLIAEAGEPFPVVGLADYLIAHIPCVSKAVEICYIGLRSGEKLTERMVACNECAIACGIASLNLVTCSDLPAAVLIDGASDAIYEAIQSRNFNLLMTAIGKLIPDYVFSTKGHGTVDKGKMEITE